MTNDSPALARNMSAPPRTTLNFSALALAKGATGEAVTDGTGLTFVCRLETWAFTPKRCRGRRRREGDWDAFSLEDRIRLAYPRVEAEARGRKRANADAHRRSVEAPVETLADELREFSAAVALADAGLPPFGIFLPPWNIGREREESLTRTIAILGRRRGSVFLRDAEPIVWTALDGELLDLWVPSAPQRRQA